MARGLGWRDRILGNLNETLRGQISAAIESCCDLHHRRNIAPRLPGTAPLPAERVAQELGTLLLHPRAGWQTSGAFHQLPGAPTGWPATGCHDLGRQDRGRSVFESESSFRI